jgi:membrane protein implicated in regulation of membrane protease activity
MRPSGLAIISLAVILIFGTAALVLLGLKVDPQDDANYAITASAVAVAALNVLFTLWLLRTAQKQLIHMRQQAREQEA